MSVVTATISDKLGAPMPATFELLSLDLQREVNRIPRCRLRLLDGDLARATFPISDHALFEPGAELSIALRYEGKADARVFRGVVVRHGLQMSTKGAILAIELMDKAVALTQPRRSRVHPATSDAAMIKALARAAGLTIGAVASTAPAEHPQLVQVDASDWDFILTRAEAQGMIVAVTDGALTVASVASARSKTHAFTFGIDTLFNVDLECDGLHQPSAVTSVAWDPEALRIAETRAAAESRPANNPLGASDGAALAHALGFKGTVLRHLAAIDRKELAAWADGEVARARRSLVRGRISVPGLAAYQLLDSIALEGFGKRFTGTSTLTGIRHRVDKDGWTTDLQFGLSPARLAQSQSVSGPPAAGLLPGITSLQIGVVAAFKDDPLAAFRVRVLVPGLDAEEVLWARLASPDAGPARGYVFRPEVGDEVVVGFLSGDPRQAVILGALFSKKNAPPIAAIKADNLLRGITSKTGVAIAIIDEEQPKVSITTPGGNAIVVSDEGVIELADSHGNAITLDKLGITFKSAADLLLDGGGGKIILKNAAEITLDSGTGKITLKGSKVEAT